MKTTTNNMSPSEKEKHKAKLELMGILFLLSLVFITLYCLARPRYIVPKEVRVLTGAVITDIKSSGGRMPETDLYLRYTVDGYAFETRIHEGAFGLNKGDTVEIYYHRDHPFKAQLKTVISSRNSLLFLALAFGAISLSAGVREIRNAGEARRRKRQKMEQDRGDVR